MTEPVRNDGWKDDLLVMKQISCYSNSVTNGRQCYEKDGMHAGSIEGPGKEETHEKDICFPADTYHDGLLGQYLVCGDKVRAWYL